MPDNFDPLPVIPLGQHPPSRLRTIHQVRWVAFGSLVGLIVLGSHDPHRFEATMGTEFLSRMAELASSALSRMR